MAQPHPAFLHAPSYLSLKDPADLSSYRAIAGSSLILKMFELVVIMLWGHLLSSDSLQFGYKGRRSTTQCTWLVSEVVQLMLRGGMNPVVTVLDCSKAFDKCKLCRSYAEAPVCPWSRCPCCWAVHGCCLLCR